MGASDGASDAVSGSGAGRSAVDAGGVGSPAGRSGTIAWVSSWISTLPDRGAAAAVLVRLIGGYGNPRGGEEGGAEGFRLHAIHLAAQPDDATNEAVGALLESMALAGDGTFAAYLDADALCSEDSSIRGLGLLDSDAAP